LSCILREGVSFPTKINQNTVPGDEVADGLAKLRIQMDPECRRSFCSG